MHCTTFTLLTPLDLYRLFRSSSQQPRTILSSQIVHTLTDTNMAHEINLRTVEEQNTTESQKIIFEVLQKYMRNAKNIHINSSELADAIQQLGATKPSRDDASGFLWDLWMVVIDLAYLIPPDHLWQDILTDAIQTLQKSGGHVGATEEVGLLVINDFQSLTLFQMEDPLMWKDLPHLANYLLDSWFGRPTSNSMFSIVRRCVSKVYANLPRH